MKPREELFRLLNQLVEQPATETQHTRLNELLRQDESLVDDYVEYMAIHSLLHWDAGLSSQGAMPQKAGAGASRLLSPSRAVAVVAASVVACLALWAVSGWGPQPEGGENSILVEGDPSKITPVVVENDNTNRSPVANGSDPVTPLAMANPIPRPAGVPVAKVASNNETLPSVFLEDNFTDAQIVGLINSQLEISWQENGVKPSPKASDYEWLRRVYLTFTGRIPTLDESDSFLRESSNRKYASLVNQVADDNERASYLAVVWTNLLIGRTEKRGVNREKLFDYLVGMFESNKPWMQTVDELITASGRNDENGAANFLLAHLNNEATPATAVTARLFLGEQISCVQCHDHPFSKDLKQNEYWALNAFFKDTQQKSVALASKSDTGMEEPPWMLVDQSDKDRMTYFTTRSGLQKAVLPSYDGRTMPVDSGGNRREKLAELLATDSRHRVARSMVNRMWAHFFGYGFTPQVDDMGTHATVSQPELLRLLTEAFVKSDYDVKRLMIWIARSDAWHLSSDLTASNEIDRPDDGEVALFSRVYVRRMTPEQVYESIRVAIRSAAGLPVPSAAQSSKHRREWVRQFATSFETDENDESMQFDGTIAQAMVMMNGEEVGGAIEKATKAILNQPTGRQPITELLDRMALAMLTREPTDLESRKFKSRVRSLSQQSQTGLRFATEDMMWAYLNSSEFQLVY